ncbi:MAG: methyltransferase [Erysipelotrichaceae bacterium]|nr:methyltransferase [Erysipelotrichaceae bacterium]
MTHYYTDNSDLKSEKKSFDYYFDNEKFTFTTDNGVFSKGGVDYGSYLLIKNTYKKQLGNNVLDLGCGYGPVGVIIKRFNKDANVVSVDVNSRAVELARENADYNSTQLEVCLCQDILTLNTTFDSIIFNPPIRAGKVVIYDLYQRSYMSLCDNGSLYIVIQKKQGAASSINKLKELFKTVTILDKAGGYQIIQATK